MSKETVRKAILVEHIIKTRVIVDIPIEDYDNSVYVKYNKSRIVSDNLSDSTRDNIINLAHRQIRHNSNTDSAYPYSENVESITLDEEVQYDDKFDKLSK